MGETTRSVELLVVALLFCHDKLILIVSTIVAVLYQGRRQPGQYVRYHVNRDKSQMLGHIHSINQEAGTDLNMTISSYISMFQPKTFFCFFSATVCVSFHFVSRESKLEETQLKELDESKVSILIPLNLLVSPSQLPPLNYRCWARTIRSDDWIGLIPVSIRHVQIDATPPPQETNFAKANSSATPTSSPPESIEAVAAVTGVVTYVPLQNGGLNGHSMDERYSNVARLDQIFCDVNSLSAGTLNVFEDTSFANVR